MLDAVIERHPFAGFANAQCCVSLGVHSVVLKVVPSSDHLQGSGVTACSAKGQCPCELLPVTCVDEIRPNAYAHLAFVVVTHLLLALRFLVSHWWLSHASFANCGVHPNTSLPHPAHTVTYRRSSGGIVLLYRLLIAFMLVAFYLLTFRSERTRRVTHANRKPGRTGPASPAVSFNVTTHACHIGSGSRCSPASP